MKVGAVLIIIVSCISMKPLIQLFNRYPQVYSDYLSPEKEKALVRDGLIEEGENRAICFGIDKYSFCKLGRRDLLLLTNNIKYIYNSSYKYYYLDFLDGTGIRFSIDEYVNGTLLGQYGRFSTVENLEEIYGTVLIKNDCLSFIPDGEEWGERESELNSCNLLEYEFNKCNELSSIKELCLYLDALSKNKDDYCIFMSIKDEGSRYITGGVLELIEKLGFDSAIDDKFAYRESLIAVILPGKDPIIQSGKMQIEYEGSLDNDGKFFISSGGNLYGNNSSICVNGIEYSKNVRGINFVVLDSSSYNLIDAVSFDTYTGLWSNTR